MKRRAVCNIAFCIIMMFGYSKATNWYVDNAATGSNNGTSWTNAWHSWGTIVWGSNGVNAGDSLLISGGTISKTYNEKMWVGASGTSNAWLTISSGRSTGHNGLVIFDLKDTCDHAAECPANYVHVTGLVGASKNILLKNTSTPATQSNRDLGVGIFCGAQSFQIWEGVQIQSCNNGISYNGAYHIEIRYCSLSDIRGDCAIKFAGIWGSASTGFDNYKIHDNVITLNADFFGSNGGPDGLQSNGGFEFYNNIVRSLNGTIVAGQHPDGVQFFGNYVKVYDNYFANLLNSGCKFEPLVSPMMFSEEVYCYNNIFTVDDAAFSAKAGNNGKGCEFGSSFMMDSSKNIIIANNIFIDLVGLAVNGKITSTASNPYNFIVENNIIYNCARLTTGTNYSSAVGLSKATIDYNLQCAGPHGFIGIVMDSLGNGTFKPFTQLHPRTGVPSFVSYTEQGGLGNDLHLAQTDNAAAGMGTTLSQYFTLDKDGRQRTGVWDLGPYKGTWAKPQAPQKLQIQCK